MSFFKGMLSESGDVSFLRVMIGFVTVVILLTWSCLCFMTREYIPLSVTDVIALLGMGAIKVWQKGKENGNVLRNPEQPAD